MKKLLFTLLVASLVVVASCSSDDESATTYDISNNLSISESTVPYLNGTMYEVVVYQYIDNNVVKQDNIKQVNSGGGKCQKMEVSNNVNFLQVSFKFLPKESPLYNDSYNQRRYVVVKTPIKKGTHHSIIISGDTMVTTNP